MRGLAFVVLCTLAAVAWAGPEDEEDPDDADDAPAPAVFDPTQTRARGFDHLAHDGKVTVTGQPSIECAACHPLDKKAAPKGRPTHDTCYGACHAGAPARAKPAKKTGKLPAVAIDEVAARLCEVCHAPSDLGALAAGTASKVPAYAGGFGEPDYGIQISHQGHDARTGCETCHATTRAAKQPPKPHQRCTACHQAASSDAGAVPMTACAACHTLTGEAHPELDHGPLEVAFTHDGHAKQATADCKACHAAVAAATTTDLGAIGHADCRSAGCHDGTGPAFATTEACTRCHAEAPAVTYPLDRPRFRFSHARHKPRIGDVACSTCHAIDARGEAPPPPHRACADGACHQKDFEIRAPQTCGACHVSIEPWRALEADALPRVETEFGAVMPHARHADLGPTCADCHSLTTSRRQKRPPRGHRSCTGDGCHAESSGPTPQLTACTSCHRSGLVSEHVHERQSADWSVRARFDHALHPGDCTACHDQVAFTDALPGPPAKASCAACHDGTTAFKMTGHGCVRCHGSTD